MNAKMHSEGAAVYLGRRMVMCVEEALDESVCSKFNLKFKYLH